MKYQYSYSRISLYEKCSAAFKFKVIDKIADIGNTAADIGITCHNIMSEYINHLKKTGQRTDIEYLFEITNRVVGESSIEIGEEVMKIIDEVKQSFILPEYSTFLESERKIAFDTEWKVIPWEDENVFLRAIMDLTWDNGDTLNIEDFKTSRKIMSETDMKNELQILLYAVCTSKLYDMTKYNKIVARLNFLRYGVIREVTIPFKRLETAETKILKTINKIENTKHFVPVICSYCEWCNYKAVCGLYVKHLQNFDIDMSNIPMLAKKLFIAKQFVSEAEKILKGHVEANGSINVGDMKLDFYPEERRSFPSKDIIKVFTDNGIDYSDVISFNQTEIKKLTKNDKDLQKKVLDMAIVDKITKFKFKEK
jgi:CRISPR/Cas system-associated exonuclease Cas4 (RecB family)